ncbi:ogr/Delta-like zinc finger family protein [Pseudomonas sp.]|uniref:ogr/Delta-like zinc finger family protein n=1 Tax=Pseudomonas sp. TaxID=306 RepID=UPI00338FE3F6
MRCPACQAWVEVRETRQRANNITYRRYQCANLHRFTTTEQVVRVIIEKKHDSLSR